MGASGTRCRSSAPHEMDFEESARRSTPWITPVFTIATIIKMPPPETLFCFYAPA